MKRRIFWSFLIVTFFSLVIFGALTLYFIDNNYTKKAQDHLKSLANVIINQKNDGNDYPALAKGYAFTIGEDVRITFVDKKGVVLGDSLPINVTENHSNRKEIKDALLLGEGSSVRFSSTDKKYTVYFAKMVNENIVIRLSYPLFDSIKFILFSLPAVFLSLLLAIFLAFLVSKKLSDAIIKPIFDLTENINFSSDNSFALNVKYDELIPIAKNFDILNDKIKSQIIELKKESNKINLILNKMREGIIILDSNKNILIMNESAKKLLSLNSEFEDKNILFLTRNTELLDNINAVISKGDAKVFDVQEKTLSKKALRLYISPFFNEQEESVQGVVILISDITLVLRAEKIRRDFVANVSHELKTPITSIKGFAELISAGEIKETETIKNYSKLILAQSERLITLVDDILLLSEVESKTKDTDLEKANISLLIKETVSILQNQAKEKSITISLDLNDVYMNVNRNTFTELILNLTDNAIKYNKEKGEIKISLFENENNIYFSVYDTGIGIPDKDKARIFERFYRVDKSRSKKSGGTGLGLSIVKHIAELYKGKISLESENDKFTKITIEFPKN